MALQDVTHVFINIKEEDIQNGALRLLGHIRSNWRSSQVKFRLLTDGITNKLIKCSHGDDVVLVRVYGHKTDLLIDRTAETRNIILLHNEKLAPALYATFENGLAYEYAPGVTLTRKTVSRPEVFRLVAAQMARLHLIQSDSHLNSQPMIWDKLEKFYNLIPEQFTESHTQKKFNKLNISRERLLKEVHAMKRALSKYNSPIVFCHNDLLLGNIVYNQAASSVTFIDYEYAAMNYQAFDIGNHFNEFAGVENVDYSFYPSKVLQLAWLREYLQVYWDTQEVTPQQLQDMYVQVGKFSLLSHLLWGLWALIQAEHSTIEFDFIRFASDRLNRYFDKKEEFLRLDCSQEQECRSKECQL